MLQPSKVAAIASIILLALAFTTRWPYGFYTFLRIAVCATAVWLAVEAYQFRKTPLAWVLAGLAVLFNPLVPIYMRRTQWRWFDFLALLVLAISVGIVRPRRAEATQSW
jgi:hypothetical protein